MKKCLIALGSNLGDRLANFEHAAKSLEARRVSPVFENPALLPEGAPPEWNRRFLNAVIEIDWSGTPKDLLSKMQAIENGLGRDRRERWSPRPLDLDLLSFGGEELRTPELQVPHPAMLERAFVIAPLKHLYPTKYLGASRKLKEQLPLWMGIVNVTPDSFAGTGDARDAHIIDLGAESTRPGATPVSPDEEWRRLEPKLAGLRDARYFKPIVSVDTRHPQTAARALELGARMINDVSGLEDPLMLELLQSSDCEYVLMHSKGVPAKAGDRWDVEDPVQALREWTHKKLEELDKAGVNLDRVILDPGIGFGKSAEQSLELLKRTDELMSLPVRLLVGHSRKSFMKLWTDLPAEERDAETLGVSLRLAENGVDILRVHAPNLHIRAHRAYKESSC